MNLAAALIYWVIIAAWLAVLATLALAFVRNPRTFGTTRLLLAVILVDTTRNVIENCYFGLYFGAKYGLFTTHLLDLLGNPALLVAPKLLNVASACLVLGLLVFRWLPAASRERIAADTRLRAQSEALEREAQERRRLFETSLDLILVTDRNGTLTSISPSARDIVGYTPEEVIGRNSAEFIFPADLDVVCNEMKLARRGRNMRNFEARYVAKNGRTTELSFSGVWSEPEQKHFFIGRDVTERNIAAKKLHSLAHFDQLTGLPNRASLHTDLGTLTTTDVHGASTAVVSFDLDGFKDVNGTLGHSFGDELLRNVADRLRSLVGANDRVYRVGGDEFVLVLSGCSDPLVATESASTILRRLGERIDISGHQFFLGASAGVAIWPVHGASVGEILSNADLALYDAKAAGGRAVRLFVPHLRARAEIRRKLGDELRRGNANEEFVLHYQPQLQATDGKVTGAEALLRWQHPERGPLAPGSFVEALADSPVAPDVGRWILATACARAAAWRATGQPIRVGVNVFPVQFRQKTLLADVRSALDRSGLPPELLELEITETIALGNDESLLATLTELRSWGVGLAFDDFGTGYASLSYLARFPFTRIKIDRSFVQKIATGAPSQNTAIVRSIIAMAHNLRLAVTAEGVETADQAKFLRARTCDELQGFLFARPLAPAAFDAFVSDARATAQVRSLAGL